MKTPMNTPMNTPFDDKITQFLEDAAMYNAVRATLESQFDMTKVVEELSKDVNPFRVTNAVLGETARAVGIGKTLLAKGFNELDRYRRQNIIERDETNPAM